MDERFHAHPSEKPRAWLPEAAHCGCLRNAIEQLLLTPLTLRKLRQLLAGSIDPQEQCGAGPEFQISIR